MSKSAGKNTKSKKSSSAAANGVEVFVPDALNTLYTDSAFITSTRFGIGIDFAQRVGNTKRQKVVARVGMSREHAEVLLGILQKKLIDSQNGDLPEQK